MPIMKFSLRLTICRDVTSKKKNWKKRKSKQAPHAHFPVWGLGKNILEDPLSMTFQAIWKFTSQQLDGGELHSVPGNDSAPPP